MMTDIQLPIRSIPLLRRRCVGHAVLAVVALCCATANADGQTIIDRRNQARAMILATPEDIYAHYCAHCHGDDATGGGRLWPTELEPKPANLTSIGQSQEYVIAAIRDGSTAHGKSNLCPPWDRTISAPNIDRLSRYIVSLGSDASHQDTVVIPAQTIHEPFPWLLAAIAIGELAAAAWLVRARKEPPDVVSRDAAKRR